MSIAIHEYVQYIDASFLDLLELKHAFYGSVVVRNCAQNGQKFAIANLRRRDGLRTYFCVENFHVRFQLRGPNPVRIIHSSLNFWLYIRIMIVIEGYLFRDKFWINILFARSLKLANNLSNLVQFFTISHFLFAQGRPNCKPPI